MKAAPIHEIKKALQDLDSITLRELCLRLAKYKNDNKGLLGYLLFEAHDEQGYVVEVKAEMELLFSEVTPRNVYFTKKTLRKILRFTNRQIKYSGQKTTELELRLFFCQKMRDHDVPRATGTVLFNLYQQQRKKILASLSTLPEDLQFDYEKEVQEL